MKIIANFFLFFSFCLSSINAQDLYLIQEKSDYDLFSGSILESQHTHYQYDHQNRLLEIDSKYYLIQYTYSDKQVESIRTRKEDQVLLNKERQSFNEQGSVTKIEKYIFDEYSNEFIIVEEIQYQRNNNEDILQEKLYRFSGINSGQKSLVQHIENRYEDQLLVEKNTFEYDELGEIYTTLIEEFSYQENELIQEYSYKLIYNQSSFYVLNISSYLYDNLNLTQIKTEFIDEDPVPYKTKFELFDHVSAKQIKKKDFEIRYTDDTTFLTNQVFFLSSNQFYTYDSIYIEKLTSELRIFERNQLHWSLNRDSVLHTQQRSGYNKDIFDVHIETNSLFVRYDQEKPTFNEHGGINFELLPNLAAANSNIKIKAQSLDFDRVEIFNDMGALISSLRVQPQQSIYIQAPNSRGIYFVRLLKGFKEQSEVKKIIIY